MDECSNIYTNMSAALLDTVPLNDQRQFRLNKINETKNYLVAEIKERELMSKRIGKYIASLDCFDNCFMCNNC